MSVWIDPQTRRSHFWMTAILVAVFVTISGATLLIPLLVTKDRNEEVIRSVGGSMRYSSGQNELVSRFREKFLGQPTVRYVYMGPVDRAIRHLRQVYNKKLRDDDLLKLDVRNLGTVRIDISGPQVTDRGFSHVAKNPNVNFLICRRAQITDLGIQSVVTGSELNYLNLTGNRLTAASLPLFQRLPHLSCLILADNPICELEPLSGPHKFYSIDISNTDIDVADLECLLDSQKFQGLCELHLDLTQVTDRTVEILEKSNRSFRSIGIVTCSARKRQVLASQGIAAPGPISDDVLAKVFRIRGLSFLTLEGHSPHQTATITPEGVSRLMSMTSLKDISLIDVQLSPAAIGAFAGKIVVRQYQGAD